MAASIIHGSLFSHKVLVSMVLCFTSSICLMKVKSLKAFLNGAHCYLACLLKDLTVKGFVFV